jgi:hypothetical protein
MGQTLGQQRVGVSFNPSKDPAVDEIKAKAAELIDLVHEIGSYEFNPEVGRWAAIALQHLETAAMFAVKAAVHAKKPETT